LKLKSDTPLSTSAFKLNLRRYNVVRDGRDHFYGAGNSGRGLHSSTFQLNLSRFWHQIHPRDPLITPDPH